MSVLITDPDKEAIRLPTEDDLPYDDGQPMESHRHVLQMTLLMETLSHHFRDRQDVFISGNMFLYYYTAGKKTPDSLGPDVLVATGVPNRERKSWLVWVEGKAPDVVIELLSETTTARDKIAKKNLYQDALGVKEYFYYDPFSDDWAGFRLQRGKYQPVPVDVRGRLPSRLLGLFLIRREGTYRSVTAPWLRWALPDGTIVPTGEELARQERQLADEERARANEERARADEERTRAERLAARLRELGIDPEE